MGAENNENHSRPILEKRGFRLLTVKQPFDWGEQAAG
jgi:hypothetical protein